MNYNVKLSDEVREALALGRPVIALESTIIAHGMPYPQNVKTALACERLARTHGAVPATIAIIGGQLCAGLTEEQIEYLGREGRNVAKVSRRDIPYIMAKGADGATTVAATMFIASNLIDEGGFLPKEYCSDNYVHQTYSAYAVWADVLRSLAARHITGQGKLVFE